MFYYILVAPVKNHPVATSTTQPRSIPTFIALVSLFFWVQLGFYCRHPVIGGRHPIIGGRHPVIGGRHPVIGGRHPVVGGRHPVIGWGNPMTGWGQYWAHYLQFTINRYILLNKQSLFNTLNIQSWLISPLSHVKLGCHCRKSVTCGL